MKINSVELTISAVRESQYPNDNKKEFLLIGRSNVGKSSFINTIINRKSFARTSATPGKTQTLNFYKVNDEFYLVDAPGYGFAKVRDSLKKKFGLIIENYLKSRNNLQMVFLLIDFRHKPTEDDVLMYNYLKYYNQYENIKNHKTGFYISFEAEGKTIEQLILDPSAKHAMTPYLYVYLYDAVNQKDGAYYSHLEPVDMKEDTIISSIKLFLAEETYKITSPITITAFTYNDEEDFTEDNKYRGISSYTVVIETK